MRGVEFTISDIVDVIKSRIDNKYDARMACCGVTGIGKSTLFTKIYHRLPGYDPWKHQVYDRNDILNLLAQFKSYVQDDEGINSGYKREFQNRGQQEMIKMLTNNRDNFPVYSTALPNFFSLDKDLRDLFFIMFHIVARGVAIVHMPVEGTLYSQDPWDSKNNAKIEEKWRARMIKDPSFRPKYHQLSTFQGYLFFNDLTDLQQQLYKEVKAHKKGLSNQAIIDKHKPTALPFVQKVYNALIAGKIESTDFILNACIMEGEKYNSILTKLNTMLKDQGIKKTVTDYTSKAKEDVHNTLTAEINNLVPTF